MTLYVLCGTSGSGKTTLSYELCEQTGAILHCFDDLPGAHSSLTWDKVRLEMCKSIAKDLRSGFDVICDSVNHKRKYRLEILSESQNIKCEKVLIVMNTPLEECLCRNRERYMKLPDFVVKTLYRQFEKPSLSEGWDEIIYYGGESCEFDFKSN